MKKTRGKTETRSTQQFTGLVFPRRGLVILFPWIGTVVVRDNEFSDERTSIEGRGWLGVGCAGRIYATGETHFCETCASTPRSAVHYISRDFYRGIIFVRAAYRWISQKTMFTPELTPAAAPNLSRPFPFRLGLRIIIIFRTR